MLSVCNLWWTIKIDTHRTHFTKVMITLTDLLVKPIKESHAEPIENQLKTNCGQYLAARLTN